MTVFSPLLARSSPSVLFHAVSLSTRSLQQQDFSKVQLGNTMVLYRAEEHRVLELLRNLCLERVLPVAQR